MKAGIQTLGSPFRIESHENEMVKNCSAMRVAATVLVGLLFSEDAAMVTSKVIWIIFDISAAVDAYIQKNKVMVVLWIVLIPISLYCICRT